MAYFVMGVAATLSIQWLWRKGYGDQLLWVGIAFCLIMLVVTGNRLASQ